MITVSSIFCFFLVPGNFVSLFSSLKFRSFKASKFSVVIVDLIVKLFVNCQGSEQTVRYFLLKCIELF